jgi:hypothetical protein
MHKVKKRAKVIDYDNGMYVGLKQPPIHINKDGTKRGYYYGNGFYDNDEGFKSATKMKENGEPLWRILLLMLCFYGNGVEL